MKFNAALATNRELDEEYKNNDPRTKHEALCEMAKRIHRQMGTPGVVAIFRQYKLNGAGDQRY